MNIYHFICLFRKIITDNAAVLGLFFNFLPYSHFLLRLSSEELNLLFNSFEIFSQRHQLMVFQWSLSDSKSPQVSRTLLNILTDLNSAVVWIVSTRVLISCSSSPVTTHLVTEPSASITIGITVTYYFYI